jgi:hypothetical protein
VSTCDRRRAHADPDRAIALLGDQLSLADLHLAAWLALLVRIVGGSAADQGALAIAKLEAHVTPGERFFRLRVPAVWINVCSDGSLVLPKDFTVTPVQDTPTIDATPDRYFSG